MCYGPNMREVEPKPKVTAPVPIPAATVLIVRDGDQGPEVLMVQRQAALAAFGGLWVFPGGKVDPLDREWAKRFAEDYPEPNADREFGLGDEPSLDVHDLLASKIAAIRETYEEAGLLYADPVSPQDHHLESEQQALRQSTPELNTGSFHRWVQDSGQTPALDRLTYWVRWVPPEDVLRRFDTVFFLAPAPEGQEPTHDGHETAGVRWVRFADFEDDELVCAPVTRVVLLELRQRYGHSGDLPSLIRDASRRARLTVFPRRSYAEDDRYVVFPWDPQYSALEGGGAAWPSAECSVMSGLPGRLVVQDEFIVKTSSQTAVSQPE